MDDPLFPDVDAREAGDGCDDAPVRYETAHRDQIELQPCDLEALLPPGHAARLVWRFVEGLDLSAFYATIRAREGRAGRPPIDPKILVALWLYATMDGVGSAREVDRLCYRHDAYRWLRGGVSVNYHTLSDFRVAHQAALDDLLTQSIAALLQRGVVTMARVAHDGTRVRGSAGAGSFRRGETLAECLRQAGNKSSASRNRPTRRSTCARMRPSNALPRTVWPASRKRSHNCRPSRRPSSGRRANGPRRRGYRRPIPMRAS
jgi:transposase